ncbi:hypothetical protein S40285_02583 [Stachybotrys chlorohalonatus IBT 40285]|uniref:Amine oxidase domain-containing protein n=1 Tax=Stachybotrys chlorohalonatus (strain IBT 40285) TaxID=1283841 RepID=A0A084QVY0_STAC4|nr:hypothetical protein S40285_02583 [Stachybotrys chlorohalonata IBT 40285]
MKTTTALPLLSLASAVLANPACIVGAGPAGLAAAHALEAKGQSVVIFEKQREVGGKCQAFYDNNYHPLGALLLINQTYPETIRIIDQTSVVATPTDNLIPQWAYNWQSGDVSAFRSFDAEQTLRLTAEMKRYTVFWTSVYQPISGVGYRRPIPEELTASTLDWLTDNGYRVLPVLFNIGMYVYGYGDIRQTPIWYMMQLFAPADLLGFVGLLPVYNIDFHEVFVQYAETVEGEIILDATISDIDRSGPGPRITYTSGSDGAHETQDCSSLILAFPPAVPALEAASLDLTTAERELFSKVQLVNYFAGAVNMSSRIPVNDVFYANGPSPVLPPDAVGQPVGFLRMFSNSNVVTTWSWGSAGETYTTAQVRRLLVETLGRLNRDPEDADATLVGLTDADIKAFAAQDYFPTVSGEELLGGWYQRFDRQQGQNNTYYASGLNAFESVEFAVRAGLDIVNTYL